MYEWVTGYMDDELKLEERKFANLYGDNTAPFAQRWIFDVLTIVTTEIMVGGRWHSLCACRCSCAPDGSTYWILTPPFILYARRVISGV